MVRDGLAPTDLRTDLGSIVDVAPVSTSGRTKTDFPCPSLETRMRTYVRPMPPGSCPSRNVLRITCNFAEGEELSSVGDSTRALAGNLFDSIAEYYDLLHED